MGRNSLRKRKVGALCTGEFLYTKAYPIKLYTAEKRTIELVFKLRIYL